MWREFKPVLFTENAEYFPPNCQHYQNVVLRINRVYTNHIITVTISIALKLKAKTRWIAGQVIGFRFWITELANETNNADMTRRLEYGKLPRSPSELSHISRRYVFFFKCTDNQKSIYTHLLIGSQLSCKGFRNEFVQLWAEIEKRITLSSRLAHEITQHL